MNAVAYWSIIMSNSQLSNMHLATWHLHACEEINANDTMKNTPNPEYEQERDNWRIHLNIEIMCASVRIMPDAETHHLQIQTS